MLAGCSSSSEWLSLDGLKPGPTLDSVRFESEPPGAEAKTSNGQSCKTPCALALPTDSPLTVTFTLQGYQTEQETLEAVEQGGPTQLRPNPVMVELTPTPPAGKPPAKPRKPPARKPAAATPKPAAASAAPAPAPAAPAAAAPAAPGGASPWPAPRQQ